ncbi:MAG: GtrA family protein [Clostridia bacterium]|nr:GtrA family protein [Clostridia bacterium]
MIRPFGLSEEETRKFIRFCMVGLSNSVIDVLVFVLCYYLFHLNTYICQVIAFMTATLNSYILNSRFTFRTRDRLLSKKMVMFYMLNVITMGISIVFIYLFHDLIGLNAFLAKLIASPLVFMVNYLGSRLIIFKGEDENIMKLVLLRMKEQRLLKKEAKRLGVSLEQLRMLKAPLSASDSGSPEQNDSAPD